MQGHAPVIARLQEPAARLVRMALEAIAARWKVRSEPLPGQPSWRASGHSPHRIGAWADDARSRTRDGPFAWPATRLVRMALEAIAKPRRKGPASKQPLSRTAGLADRAATNQARTQAPVRWGDDAE
jgi:hypothetical protein